MALTKIPASLLDTTAGLTVAGDLTVSGTTTTLNSTTLQVVDKNIVLNYHASNDTSSTADGAGITIQDAVDSSNNATILWDATNDEFDFSHQATLPGLKLGVNTSLFNQDAAISYYASNNGVYVNGAGTNGWLRLNASGAENARNSIDLYGQAGGDYIKIKAANTDTMYIGANGAGRVGIGTSTPSHALHVVGGDNDEARVRVHNSASGQASLDLDNSEGYFRIFTDGGKLRVYDQTDGAFRLDIDTSGNVGIGTSSPSSTLHVTSTTANTNGMVRLQNNMDNNYETLRIESLGDYDAHIGFFADGSANYYWGMGVDYSDSGKFKIANDNLLATNTRLTLTTAGQIQSKSLGVSTPTFSFDNDTDTGMTRPTSDTLQFVCGGTVKNRISSDGLLFNSDTAAANALDDYEEGTWTPTINSGTMSGAGGYYTKIGRVVHVSYYYNLSTLGSSNAVVQIGGLPFAAKTASGDGHQTVGSILCRYFSKNQIVSYLGDNLQYLTYYNNGSGGFDVITFGEIEISYDNDFAAHGSHTYITS